MSEEFEILKDDDVLQAPATGILNQQTFSTKEFMQGIRMLLGSKLGSGVEKWLGEGVACRLLRADGSEGWQPGKVRVRLEFVPDETQPEKLLDEYNRTL
jgi:hypothetical protein